MKEYTINDLSKALAKAYQEGLITHYEYCPNFMGTQFTFFIGTHSETIKYDGINTLNSHNIKFAIDWINNQCSKFESDKTKPEVKMTRHKCADVLISIANGDDVQYQKFCEISDKWVEASRDKDCILSAIGSGSEIRIKPRTIMIGDVEVPEPLRTEPSVGQLYYRVAPQFSFLAVDLNWCGTNTEKIELRQGMLHLTKEAAITHAKALIKISGGAYEEN